MGSRSARRYFVSGKVQGVGYRYFAQKTARDLAIKGFAKNLADGRVEVLAMGQPKKLDAFEGELKIGPPRAEVRGIVSEETPVDASFTSFLIR